MFKQVKEFFQFSNTEHKGFLTLIALIIIAVIAPRIYFAWKPPSLSEELSIEYLETEPSTQSDSIAVQKEAEPNKISKKVVYVNFNPNTVSKDELIHLGVPTKTASTLINFRNKGGKFYKKEDLLKVYGLNNELYQKLAPYIIIPAKKSYTKPKKKDVSYPNTHSKPVIPIVDINLADSAQFTQLRGIGPVYANRIVKYRKLLGGFTHQNQITEVYGITDSLYQTLLPKLTISPLTANKISINNANVKELKAHPYISHALASGIVNYREANGQFDSIADMKKLYILDDETYQKIAPYLSP